MITMVITILALVGYIGANMVLQQTTAATFEKTVALQDANQVIEDMRDRSGTGNFPGNVTGTYPNNGVVAGFNSLTGEQIVVSYADATADPLEVTVAVSWQEEGRRAASTSLRTLMTQRASS